MKNYIYFFALLIGINFSCSEDSDPQEICATENVLNDLPWLADLIETEESSFIGQSYSFISSGKYKSRRVFILYNCCPNCSMLPPPVYDCSGNLLGRVGDDEIKSEKLEDMEVIWKSSLNSCNI